MALNSSEETERINEIANDRPHDIEEIRKAVERVHQEGLKPLGPCSLPGLKKNASFSSIILSEPDITETAGPSLKKRCRLFLQGGRQRGKTLFSRSRRISKRIGGSFIGSRSNRYTMGDSIDESGKENSMCLTHKIKPMKNKERARRSRLAEDALFYEDTFESSHMHGHVEEENPKSFLQILHKKSKSSKRKKASPSTQSPIAENCICLKYLNPQKKFSQGEVSQIHENTLEEVPNINGARPKKSKASNTIESNGNQSLSETDSLQTISPTFRPSSVDIGMLLSLSLTDPIVTTFNNNGMPEPKNSILTTNKNINSAPLALQLDGRFVSSHRTIDPSLPNMNEDPCSSGHHLNTPTTHTQIDFTNFLIPGQKEIIQCPFYWGKIDRYEAESLLADKPEGSFLLRDSAQEDFVFSVSFRRYSRSLHARIEEDRHTFSFDSHDPGVHASHSVRGLLEHYKDPLSCMFFEPMLLFPVVRKTVFSLQSLARASICDRTHYGGVSQLPLPKVLKQYLREYHYKHKIRTRYIDTVHDLSR